MDRGHLFLVAKVIGGLHDHFGFKSLGVEPNDFERLAQQAARFIDFVDGHFNPFEIVGTGTGSPPSHGNGNTDWYGLGGHGRRDYKQERYNRPTGCKPKNFFHSARFLSFGFVLIPFGSAG